MANKKYRQLLLGSAIKPNDEYQTPDGEWHVITEKIWNDSPIWKVLKVAKASYPIRRPLN